MDDERYMKSIYKLHEACQQLQRQNERCVTRLHYIKKLTKRQQKDVALLKSRLDLYNDGWRTAQPDAKIRPVVAKTITKTITGTSMTQASARSTAGQAAPITKRKRSSQTSAAGTTNKRQSINSRANPEMWKANAYPLDDWAPSGQLEHVTMNRKSLNSSDFHV